MKRIVAAEAGTQELRLFYRDEGGALHEELRPFAPWCLAADEVELPAGTRIVPLQGSQALKYRLEFPDAASYAAAQETLKGAPGVLWVRDLLQQALSITGLRFFEEMDYREVRRFAFAVTADPETEEITAIACRAGEWSATFTRETCGSEQNMLEQFNAAIIQQDPDWLEGYNCCRTDLPLLVKRAKKLKFSFTCGRDGGGFVSRASRFAVAEKLVAYTRFSLFGRTIVDLYFLALFFDAAHRDFDGLELSSLQEYFHLSGGDAPSLIAELGALLEPAWFYRAAHLPLGFQDCLVRGSGSALDALFLAEYQRANHSVPFPEEAQKFAGALTGMEAPGVFHQVRHCDVRSLYPSLLLHLGKAPARDELGIFLNRLAELRKFRLTAKDHARALPPGAEKSRWEALQSSCKILINSFYGYLGFSQGCFNDYALAAEVTAAGRNLLTALAAQLETLGATIIEMDTDGIYFCMPEAENSKFDDQLRSILPEGIELDFDAEYPAMFSYRAKNYALLHADGSITLAGAALKSRALEGFQRRYIRRIAESRLLDRPELAESEYAALRAAIETRTIPLAELAKSEVLSDSPENYRKKQNSPGARRSAAYELALASGRRFRTGDQVRFYVTGDKAKIPVVGNSRLLDEADPAVRDENVAYYLAKLDEVRKNFA